MARNSHGSKGGTRVSWQDELRNLDEELAAGRLSAEDYHQQYLSEAKNPYGYCGIGGTGVCMSDPSEEAATMRHPGQASSL